MKIDNSNPWTVIEQLNDPATSETKRCHLERQIQGDPNLREMLRTFRILQEWRFLEGLALVTGSFLPVLARLEREAVDREISRVFPRVAAAALAATIILGLLNLGSMQEFSHTPIDALFGLPQPTLEDSLIVNL